MNKAVAIARRLYGAIKELDEIGEKLPHHHPLSDQRAILEKQQEEAEEFLADVLCDLKQWSAEP